MTTTDAANGRPGPPAEGGANGEWRLWPDAAALARRAVEMLRAEVEGPANDLAQPFLDATTSSQQGPDRLLGTDADIAEATAAGQHLAGGRPATMLVSASWPPYYFEAEARAGEPPAAQLSTSGPPSAPVLPVQQVEYYFVPPAAAPEAAAASFDVERVRREFPVLAERVHGHQLVWLDNAATTQKPQAVIDRLDWYYAHENSNVHRAAHEMAARSTDAYEGARDTVARFLGAGSRDEIVFVRGTTEAINLVAQSWGHANVTSGDEIVVSHLEHHANIVPWHLLAQATGARLRVIPVDDSGQICLEDFGRLLNDRTRLVAIAHVSNALGTIVPVAEVVRMAHAAGARVLVDGAQSVAHMRVNVRQLDPDFYVFSGHKVYGPTGIGALWARYELLEQMPPRQGGGSMIRDVTFERTLYQDPPARFEAGTPNVADAVGLGTALDWLEQVGLENVTCYEQELLGYATEKLTSVPGLRLIGTAPDKASVLSFVLDGWRPEDVGSALDRQGIAVRAGHHCAQPIVRRFGLEATVRSSLALYNTRAEVDKLVDVLNTLVAARHP